MAIFEGLIAVLQLPDTTHLQTRIMNVVLRSSLRKFQNEG